MPVCLSVRHGATNIFNSNRLNLNDQLEQAVARAAASEQSFALMFLDLDGFKKINDRFGHDIGDDLLIGVARRLKETVRETDVVARLGGDEFVVLLHARVRQLNAQVIDCYGPRCKNVYYKRASCWG